MAVRLIKENAAGTANTVPSGYMAAGRASTSGITGGTAAGPGYFQAQANNEASQGGSVPSGYMAAGRASTPGATTGTAAGPGYFESKIADDGTVPGDATPGTVKKNSSGYGRSSGSSSSSASASYSAPALSYEAPRLPSAASQEEYVNRMYDAYRAQQEADLKAAYEQNLATMNRDAERLPETYDQAARQAAVQAEINRQNFNNSALASGLNTGAGSQVRLSQDNAALGNLASIRRAQSNAQADIDFQRAQLETQYKNAIASAVANNDLQRAQALYNEAKRVDDSLVATAINQANLDWSVWNALYNRR